MSRIADLLRAQGAEEAAAIRENARIRANTVNTIGAIAGAIPGAIVKEIQDRPKRELEALEMSNKRTAEERQARLYKLFDESANLTPEQFIEQLRAHGLHEEADKMHAARIKQLGESADTEKKQFEVAEQRIVSATRLLDSLHAEPEENRAAAYTALLPQIRQLVGPQLGARVPDDYDPAFVEKALSWGMSAAEKLRAQADARTAARTDRTDADTRDRHAREALLTMLPTVDTAEEWADAQAFARANGAKPETLKIYGLDQAFSPDGAKRAADRAREVASGSKRASLGSLEDFIETKAREQGRPADSFSSKEKAAFKQEYDALNDKSDPLLAELRAMRIEEMKRRQNVPEMSPAQFNMANKLADDFARDSKNFIERAQSFGTVSSASKDPSGAADISLIFAYMKMLDPGSVVREGEFATAEQSAGIPARIRNLYNKAVNGERLTPEQRAEFLKQANNIYSESQRRQQRIIQTYTERANTAKVPVSLVVMDYGVGAGGASDATDDVAAPGGVTPPGTFSIVAPDGQTYTFPSQKALDDFKKAAGIKG